MAKTIEIIDKTYPNRVGQKVWYVLRDGTIIIGTVDTITRDDGILIYFPYCPSNLISFSPDTMATNNKEGKKKVQQRALQIMGKNIETLEIELNNMRKRHNELVDEIDW